MITVYNEPWKLQILDLKSHSFPGKLICFEGQDGSGKTSILEGVKIALERRGIACCSFLSPSKVLRQTEYWSTFGNALDNERGNIDPFGLSIMALGDRLIVQERYIKPALAQGMYVLMDRYILNQVLYQSCDAFAQLSKYIYRPDFGFIVDVDPAIAFQRITQRSETENEEDTKAKTELRNRYIALGTYNGYRIINTDYSDVSSSVKSALSIMGYNEG